MFPLDEDRVLEFVRESTRFMTQEWLARAVFTRPQIHEDYGSIIVIPEGLPASTLVPLLLDASGVDLGIFAVYHSGPITQTQILSLIQQPEDDTGEENEFDVYAFGATAPMSESTVARPGRDLANTDRDQVGRPDQVGSPDGPLPAPRGTTHLLRL